MRWAWRIFRALLFALALLAGTTASLALASQTAWFRDWLRRFIVSKSSEFLNGELSIGRLDGNLFYGIGLRDVAVSLDGEPLISLQDVAVRYNAWQLISQGLSIDEIRLTAPVLRLRERDDGWTIARLLKRDAAEADRQGPLRAMVIDRIVVRDGMVTFDTVAGAAASPLPARIDGLTLAASLAYAPVRYSLNIEHLSFQTTSPDLRVRALTGKIAVRDAAVYADQISLKTDDTSLSMDGSVQDYLSRPVLKLRVTSQQVSIPEIARVVPFLAGVELRPSITLTLNGPLDALRVDAEAQSSAGGLTASLAADLLAPGQSVAGNLSVRHLDVAPLLNSPRQKSDITADATLDISGETLGVIESLHGTLSANARVAIAGYVADRVDASATLTTGRVAVVNAQAFAYGARVSAAGRIAVPKTGNPVSFDLRGVMQRINLRALPSSLMAPRLTTNVNASYHALGSASFDAAARSSRRVQLDATFADSTMPGLRVTEGSTAHVDLQGTAASYRTDAGVKDLDLREIGEAFQIAALTDERYRSAIEGHVMAAGRGTSLETLDADATGTVASATFMGGDVSNVQFAAAVRADTARVEASGAFTGFDPASLSGTPEAKGELNGEARLEAVVSSVSSGITLDNASGSARVSLNESTVGGLGIDRAGLNADYAARVATVRDLSVSGRDVNLLASGTLNLGDEGESNLVVHLNSPRVEEIGRIFDLPLTGIARADGTVTGNRGELKAAGRLEADGLEYHANGALTLRSTFAVRVPDLTFARASGEAESRATFVTLAGQTVNELSAKTAYGDGRVTFDVTARQPQRQLDAAGALILHPDRQEMHLERLVLQTAGQQWQVPEREAPVITYGAKTIGVQELRLVSGGQEISADGRFGAPGEMLRVRLSNVDLTAVDALLLRPPQFSGRLAASSTIAGTIDAPRVEAQFEVTSGGFRQFRYETFGGQIKYQAGGLTLDTRLQQNATQWLTASGSFPLVLFRSASGPEAGAGRPHVAPSPDAATVDLTIDSSPLSLGLIQGLTTEVQDVDGTVEAHLTVTGSVDDPHPRGAITIADGRMKVGATGVSYTNIAGRVDLLPDRVHIDQITVLDRQHSALSLTGDLAIHAGDLGSVRLWLNAEDFHVLDNRMGNVRVNSAIEIAGELRAPDIRGDLGVSTGRLDVDEVIALVGSPAYSTRPIETPADPGGDAAVTSSAPPFDALRMNLRLTVPDDLIVKADSLQAPGASVGLGALNVTLGGDLTATKEPHTSVRVVGTVNTVRGTYDFQGRRFDILRDGTVRFDGGESLTPVLDLHTRREIQGVEARVGIRGRLDRPEIELRSTPPLEDADILSLIVFNQPINQLGEGQQASLAERAQAMAAGAVAGQLAQSIGGALNLDTFEINLGPENGAAAELTLGQQIGRDLYVKVQQDVGGSSATNLIVEYAFARWLRLQTNMVQGATSQQSVFRRQQGSGADLIFLFSR